MSASRRLLLLLLLACTTAAAAAPALPPLLEPWRDWVLADEPWRGCAPLLDAGLDDEQGRVCAWPGALRIEASATGARFSQRWTLQARGLVPLPGDARHRPLDVQRDGRPIEVLMVGGAPTLQLEAGEHVISGRFAWQRRPEALAVPEATALLSLELDGRAVVPVERRDGRLWLGRGETQAETEALAVRVFRRVDDAVPLRLNTEFQLDVAGRAREQVLGIALPPGFLPVSLSSALPAKLDAEGRLHVQLRPGSWRLHLAARAAAAEGAQLGPVVQPAPWPEEEIWSFRGQAELRVVQPEGQRPVDPDQVGAPWGEPLPSFALGPDERLVLTEVSRGRDPDLPHRLHLQRELWLDFSGDGYTARDRVSGQLAAVGRLDLGAPWELRRAAQEGEDLLVTRGGSDGASGVELRSLQVALDATARHEDGRLLGATGWQQDFESASLRLHLPPGWKLLAAGGADQAPGAWIERWTLLDLFWLSVLCLLAHRLGGWALALPLGAVLVLGWHESGLPSGWLSLALALGLLAGLLRAGRLNTLLRWARGAALLALLLFALPFVGTQLQWALFPQLERAEVGRAGEVNRYDYADAEAGVPMPQVAMEMAPPPAPAAPPPPPPESFDRLEEVTVTGSRLKRADANLYQQQPRLNLYPKDAVVQAGLGLPDWSWASQSIRWDGPVTAEQGLSLWLTPPWLTALWRLALCALFAVVLLRLLRPKAGSGGGWLRGTAAAGLLFTMLPLQAAEVPSTELLEQLRERLVQSPPCGSQCAALARVQLQVVDGELRLALDWHAVAETAVPLPQSGSRWQPSRLQVNGRDAEAVNRDGRQWLRLERGLQRVSLAGALGGLESLDLQFLHLPAELQVVAPGWEVAGLVEGRLQSDSLQLVRAAERGATGEALGGSEFPPFVEVSRTLNLDLEWTISTVVRRVAPEQGGFSIAVPLLPGEQPLEEDLVLRDGQAQLSFGAGVDTLRWQSRLPVGPSIRFSAPPLDRLAEYWEVSVGPFWSVHLSGPPELNLGTGTGDGRRRFRPLPGEALELAVQRPEALRGGSVAIDQATASWRFGQRSADVSLDFRARATRGGQHVLGLPEGAELVSVSLRGEAQNLRLQGNRLSLPLLPGDNAVAIAFRLDRERGFGARAEGIDLGTDSANLRTEVYPGEGRWLLWASSDGIGPVVLYWPQLLLLVLAAWLLARHAPTPLRWPHWLLLGLGFSTVSWWAALVVAAWLIALGWRAGHPPSPEHRWRFIGVQLGLVALTGLALLCLLAAIPYGLLGDPDMQVAGNGSSAGRLVAFLDRSAGALPTLSLFALPLWLYKAAILLWSLWLANALLGWLRWGIEALRRGGAWPPRKPPVVTDQPVAAAPPAAEA